MSEKMRRTNNIDWTQIWTKLKKIKVTSKYGLGLELKCLTPLSTIFQLYVGG